MSHTPGPWTIFPDGRIGSKICTTVVLWPGALGERGAGNTIGEAMANAKLIAAAPDLLAELREIVKGWKVIEEGHVRGRKLTDWEKERLQFARAVITKAIGS